ncbi:unnamed protein product [Ceratitis capitata]|uniref:(Mediterranean fruit fly) hypothetical protein n=1 Tax=Ceratitis capitata TaxID=7213 RepID=A0A811V954_CERCA|nr:unnamed protein product [Ceratitis capitata]
MKYERIPAAASAKSEMWTATTLQPQRRQSVQWLKVGSSTHGNVGKAAMWRQIGLYVFGLSTSAYQCNALKRLLKEKRRRKRYK